MFGLILLPTFSRRSTGRETRSFPFPGACRVARAPNGRPPAPVSRSRPILLAALGAVAVLAMPARAQFTDFMSMDLEDLSYVSITTLGRTEHAVVDYPAAATVLGPEDIERTGATSLAETLRGVPGLHVARIDAFDYAISIRGFNDNTSNKLLVLADGRSLRDGTFSGTNWSMHEMIMADLERIEVLRGPSASLWGANAMNGFINVVSKSARATLGTHIAGGLGDHLNDLLEIRQGWMIDGATAARVYAKTQSHDGFDIFAPPATTDWRTRLVGTRIDRRLGGGGELTVIGESRHLELTGNTFQPILVPPYQSFLADHRHTDEYNISLRLEQPINVWNGTFTAFTNVERTDDSRATFKERRMRYTVDLQAKLNPLPRHQILTGVTYERTDDDLGSTGIFSFSEPSASTTFIGAFLQDEYELIPDHLRLTVGGKIEQNSYSGVELQPSARAIWSPLPTHRLWVGWSRAARTPTRAERSVNYFAATNPPTPEIPLPIRVSASGSTDFNAEYVHAFEAGYRFQPHPRLLLELTGFYNDYSDLRGFLQGDAFVAFDTVPYVQSNVYLANDVAGHTHGGELALNWRIRPNLRIDASHATISHDLTAHRGNGFTAAEYAIDLYADTSPEHSSKLHIAWNPLPRWQLDTSVRHHSAIRYGQIPAYTALDLRVAWTPVPHWEISLLARDLLDSNHREYTETFSQQATPNIARSFELRVTFER